MSAHFDFSSLSSDWLDESGPMKMLHRMNDARLRFVKSYVEPGQLGLDVGSGAGIFPIALAQDNYTIHALEKSEDLVTAAKKHCQEHQLELEWHVQDFMDFDNEQSFDYITCFEVIEHVEQRRQFFDKLLRTVKPGGLIFLSTLNRSLASYLVSIIGAEYLLKILPVGTHDYSLYLRPEEISHHMPQAKPVDIRGLVYNPFTSKFFLGQSQLVNYIGVWQRHLDISG